jgi:hypothetical protein
MHRVTYNLLTILKVWKLVDSSNPQRMKNTREEFDIHTMKQSKEEKREEAIKV